MRRFRIVIDIDRFPLRPKRRLLLGETSFREGSQPLIAPTAQVSLHGVLVLHRKIPLRAQRRTIQEFGSTKPTHQRAAARLQRLPTLLQKTINITASTTNDKVRRNSQGFIDVAARSDSPLDRLCLPCCSIDRCFSILDALYPRPFGRPTKPFRPARISHSSEP